VFVFELAGQVNGIARGAGDIGDDGAIVLQNGIRQRGFSGIGFADNGNADAFGLAHFWRFAEGVRNRLQGGVDGIDELAEIATVFGGDCDALSETELGEVRPRGFVFVVIDLIHHQQHGSLRLAEFLAESGIDRGDAIVGIDDKQNQIGSGNGDIGLKSDLLGKAVIERRANAAGIDDFTGKLGHLRGCGEAVTGNACLIVNDGDFSTNETIEQSRLSHIRATNDSNSGHGGIMSQSDSISKPKKFRGARRAFLARQFEVSE